MNRDIDLDEEENLRGRSSAHGRRSGGGGRGEHGGNNGSGGAGNRKLAIIGGTVGVVVLALVAYFVTRPSGNSGNGAVADPTSASQNKMNQTTPSAGGMGSATATSGAAGGNASSPPAATATATAPGTTGAAAVDIARVHAAVFNASGVNQRALMIKNAMVRDGFAMATVGGNMAKTAATKIYYPSTRADSAAAVAKALAIPTANLTQSNTYTEVTVVIGTDWTTGDTYPVG